jgi:hypothetical protein
MRFSWLSVGSAGSCWNEPDRTSRRGRAKGSYHAFTSSVDHKARHVWARTTSGIRCVYMTCNTRPDAPAIATVETEEAQRSNGWPSKFVWDLARLHIQSIGRVSTVGLHLRVRSLWCTRWSVHSRAYAAPALGRQMSTDGHGFEPGGDPRFRTRKAAADAQRAFDADQAAPASDHARAERDRLAADHDAAIERALTAARRARS